MAGEILLILGEKNSDEREHVENDDTRTTEWGWRRVLAAFLARELGSSCWRRSSDLLRS